jgi:hypothetical protein
MNLRDDNEFTNRPALERKRALMVMLQRAVIALFVIYCVATMGLLLWLGVQGQASRQQLTDCTTPVGKCYRESQQRTAEAIQALINDNQLTRDTVIAAIACGQDPANDTKEEVLVCIRKNK